MDLILKEQIGYVTRLTLNRPESLNAMSTELFKAVGDAMDAIDVEQTRCVVITGAGKAFAAGIDISELVDLTPEQAKEYVAMIDTSMRKVENCAVPVIAAVNGHAMGAGCELAMSCDIRIATEKACFGEPEVAIGIVTSTGNIRRLARLVGYGKTREMFYSARRINGVEAYRIGLANEVWPDAETVMEKAMQLAEEIAAQAPRCVRVTKQAINDAYNMDFEGATTIPMEPFSQCFGTEDQKNAMTAFLEKRPHEPFTGR